MEQNACIECKNTNCLFKSSLSRYPKEIEKFNIKSGINVYLENMQVKGLYVVQNGSIHEYFINRKGRKEIGNSAKNGEIFGHKDFNATKHLFSAVAIEKSSICLIDKSTLMEVCKNNLELSIKLIYFFSDELNKSDKKYSII
ncbi:MAG: cyclic nucleotide-binding domain-containing protein [Bacteroidetes bacterium]|nr:cyclic nucleotide-binding domain-containing protein [Bacteroidota bacterium]NOG94881.1 cyclic nucleotide-binding domain-containing protein [Bacteroidota bacterium]